MNEGLLGFPGPVPKVSPYRFLDTVGLPIRAGDVSRFSAVHLRADAGDATNVWRPADGDHVATLSLERACVKVQTDATLGVAILRCPVEVDCILELLVNEPGDDPALNFAATGFLSVFNGGVGAGIGKFAATSTDMTWSESGRTVQTPGIFGHTIDLTDSSFDISFDSEPTNSQLPARQVTPIFVRLRRTISEGTSTVTAYVSDDSYSWRQIKSISVMDVERPSIIGVLVIGTATLPFTAEARIAGIKFLDPRQAV